MKRLINKILDVCKTRRGAHYISSIVLGFNDALVEMTGALAGFTIALHNNRLIVLAAITTGVAATLSMAAAEFLSKEADETRVSSVKAALATGAAYLLTVVILLVPFLFGLHPLTSLIICLVTAAILIFLFTFTVGKIRNQPFLGSFLKMLVVSFCVALLAFIISWAANIFWGVDL